jgi:predicted dehydrogenase
MHAGVSPVVHIYAPLGPDVIAHLGRLAAFNARRESPTSWQAELHAGPQPLKRMLAEKPGNVVIVSGRNRGKIDVILASLRAGLHVLADKPWVIEAEDLGKLRQALEEARRNSLAAVDIMTERYEVTSRLQRELVNDPDVFGHLDPGTPERPAVSVETEHFLCKSVAGAPLRRPAWFFDTSQQGEGLSDVGTHAADLVTWCLFPGQGVREEEVELLRARRTPTVLSRSDFEKVTGEPDFPDFLLPSVHSSQLLYQGNTTVLYRLRGAHVWLNIAWGFEAPPGRGDNHLMRVRGTRSSIEVRQGEAELYIPEVYIVPGPDLPGVRKALHDALARLQPEYPGVAAEDLGGSFRLSIPAHLRTSHEAHFGEITRQFLAYLRDPASIPEWELPNMITKYHVTTHGVRLARASA